MESFKPFVGVFLKKFRKFSHKMVSRFFNHPQFMLENSAYTSVFWAIFLSYNCYYEKYSVGSVKNIQDEIPFDLPAGWSWCRLNSICNLISDIDHKMPKSVNDGVLFLSAKDLLNDGTINYDVDVKRISEEDYLRLSKKAVPQINDIIYSRIGACLGKARVVNRNVRFLVSYSCCTIRSLMIDSTFLALILDGNFVLKQAKKETQSVGVPDLGIKNIKDFLIPIPPLNEQSRIDTCLKNALSLVDNISYNATCVDEYIDVLQSRILELAIQGKLVPQDENDEPASVLLERIRAERKAKLGKKYVESYIYKGDDNCYYENNVNNPVEIPFVLPEGWAFSRLEEVAWLEDSIKSLGEELPYLDVKTIRGKQNATILSSGKIIEKGMQVILVDGENSGEVFEVPCRGYMGSTFRILKVSSYVGIDYIRLILDYYKNLFKDNKTGSAIPHLNKKIFKSLIIGIPPIEEQKAIVNRVKFVAYILKDGD